MKRALAILFANALLTAVYFAAARLGLSLAFVNESASAVWPPTGIALAAILLLGYRIWPGIWAGAFLANFTNTNTAGFVEICSIIATGNTLEALLGATLVEQFAGGRRVFDRAADIFRFVFYAAVISTAISSSIGTTSLSVYGLADWERYGTIWLTWWLGDMVSALIITPVLVIWLSRPPRPRGFLHVLEGMALLISVAAAGLLVFGPWVRWIVDPQEYVIILPLLWAAFRFRQRGASLAAFIISGIALWGTLSRHGPFVLENTNTALLLLQLFMATMTVTALVLAAIVTERRLAQMASQDWEVRFRQLAENIREVFYIRDLHPPRMVYVSPGYEQVWGRNCQSLYDNPSSFLDCIHPDDRGRLEAAMEKQIHGRTMQDEYRVVRPDGSIRWVYDRAVPIKNKLGEVYRITGIAEDVTERRHLEEQRSQTLERERAARKDAELASRAKDNFLAVLSHELRTPLTPVLLITSLLERQDGLPADVHEHLKTIRHNVELEARLIDDLLDLTRVARGKLQLNREVADVHEILTRSVDICRRDDKAPIELSLASKHHHVRADPARLQQVFCNLLSNAQKFTPANGVIRVRSTSAPPDSIRIEVQDTGMGIDPQMLPKLFNAFEQVEGSGAKRMGGLGLGLAISKALVKAHGGNLTAASEGRGKGASFTVELQTTAPVARSREGEAREAASAVRRPLNVLLVEDHVPTQRAMSKLLEKMGHRISAAGDVKSALGFAQRSRFDLVISDLGLPDGSGHELMNRIRQQYGIAGIALSGYGMESDVRRSREAGFVEHLTKPVTLEMLEEVIARVTK